MSIDGIAKMLEGSLMPRRPTILASLVTVTFIGLGELPKAWIHSTFQVRQNAVCDALLWLKVNNSKYYGDIEISDSHLEELLADNIPDEIMSIIHQSDDVGMVKQESVGYVPQDDNEGQYYQALHVRESHHYTTGMVMSITGDVVDDSPENDGKYKIILLCRE